MAQPCCPKCSKTSFKSSPLAGSSAWVIHCAACGCIVAGWSDANASNYARLAMSNSYAIGTHLKVGVAKTS